MSDIFDHPVLSTTTLYIGTRDQLPGGETRVINRPICGPPRPAARWLEHTKHIPFGY